MPYKEEYARRKAGGLCTVCGRNPAEEGSVNCKACREYRQTPKFLEFKREYNKTITGKASYDKANAKRRGYSWELSINQAGVFYMRPCHYCGEVPNGSLNGIDRQDSTVGYAIENCVPCCPTCNYAKRQLSPDEFLWHCTKVVQFNKKGRNKDDHYNQLTIGK